MPIHRAPHARMLLGCAAIALNLTGCAASSDTSRVAEAQASQQTLPAAVGPEAPAGLLIQGYNYTDQYINSFTVNGQGGGNVHLSSAESGGGGSVCCHTYLPGTQPMLTIRWTASYCTYTITNRYGERSQWRRGLWREVTIPLSEVQTPAKALEVHFYKDGRVEAAVTPGYSLPRLILPVTPDRRRPGPPPVIPVCSDEPTQP